MLWAEISLSRIATSARPAGERNKLMVTSKTNTSTISER